MSKRRSFWYAKFYLLCLFLLIHMVALLDDSGIPYFPIELGSLLATYHTRKSLFLAGIVPVCLLLWVSDPNDWPLRGLGMGLFLMILFDVGNEWPLHILGVVIFAFCMVEHIRKTGRPRLAKTILALYTLRLVLKLLYVWSCEYHQYSSFVDRYKELSALGCSGYTQCEHPFATVWFFRCCAVLQWMLFILLSLLRPPNKS